MLALSAALLAQHAYSKNVKKKGHTGTPAVVNAPKDGVAEARLIEIYKLIGRADVKQALARAEHLVQDFPNFQLAQLVYGDLLSSRTRVLKTLGDIPINQLEGSDVTLNELRNESYMRIKALRERPPLGAIPSEFLLLSPRNKHAIAIDASRARLYLFENQANGLTLVADYYISIGKSGLEKKVEGDLRTPLGIYFITSLLNPNTLKDYYGSGALPINYPNVLDIKRGKTGGGIWLHGTPRAQFSRPPLASDGCVVLTNPDLEHIIKTVEIRSTPVVISSALKWVSAQTAHAEANHFENSLKAWLKAKSEGRIDEVAAFYANDFNSNGKSIVEWLPVLRREVAKSQGRAIEVKDLSLLRWTDASDTMLATFGEVLGGQRTGQTKRQYWIRHSNQWKIFYEGVI